MAIPNISRTFASANQLNSVVISDWPRGVQGCTLGRKAVGVKQTALQISFTEKTTLRQSAKGVLFCQYRQERQKRGTDV